MTCTEGVDVLANPGYGRGPVTEQAQKRPLITANMVTFARLVPMPVICWLIYRGEIWTTLIIGTLIGCTDFVDGYLARKHGPTVLGGLMDPIADKVFIAFAYFPFADPSIGVVPAWAVALMFVREFLVTALRSAYEQRGLTLKTSYLGKFKTWTQMQGLGMLVLFLLLIDYPKVMYGLLFILIGVSAVAVVVYGLIKKRLWIGATLMSVCHIPILVLYEYSTIPVILDVIMIVVVSLTWLSGVDYVMVGVRELRGRGDFGRHDMVRILGALILPCLIFAALVETAMPAWPLVAILAVELAVGGLDNLLSHHKAAVGALGWGLRVLVTSALLGAGIALTGHVSATLLNLMAYSASAISIVGVGLEFYRGRDYYIDSRLRHKALQTSES